MLIRTGVCLLVLAMLAGCSTASKKIAATYTSPQQYQSYDCAQLAQESHRILVRVKQLGVQLDQAAANDQAIGVVGAVLFWPALLALGDLLFLTGLTLTIGTFNFQKFRYPMSLPYIFMFVFVQRSRTILIQSLTCQNCVLA